MLKAVCDSIKHPITEEILLNTIQSRIHA